MQRPLKSKSEASLDPPNRPALRLVSTKALSNQEWLEVRQGGIGSSDAAAAVGLSPHKSTLELWLEKTRRDIHRPPINPDDDTTPVYWGKLLEHIVAAAYAKRTGNRVRRIHAVLQHPDHPWMLANLDREVVGSPDVQILECKTAGRHGARLWDDGVPEYVQLQVMHQLAVTGKQTADVAVLVCGQELRVHRIQRCAATIERLIALEARFWQSVQEDVAPPADGSDSADRALRSLFARDSGDTLDLSAETEMASTFSDLVALRDQITQHGKTESQLKQRIQQRMGEASRAVFERGSVTWKRSADTEAVDFDRLAKEHPDWVVPYRVQKPGSRRFLVQG